jgi:hypothetical protein
VGSDPEIISQLLEGLHTWRSLSEFTNKPMIWDQTQIGWRGILEGTLGTHWMEQQQYYSTTARTHSMKASKWAHLTVRKLWIIAWEMWKHRNAEAHNNDQEEIKEKLKEQITQEFELGHQGYADLERWFSRQELDQVSQGISIYDVLAEFSKGPKRTTCQTRTNSPGI